MTLLRYLMIAAIAASLAACGTRSASSISAPAGAMATPLQTTAHAKDPSTIPVLETDVTDHKYHSLGDIDVTVSKWTIFDADPTREKVNEALRKRAADLGADAVILVRYGTVGIGAFTWGKLEGKGRAIAYDN